MSPIPIPAESSFRDGPYDIPELKRRRQVLRETLAALEGSPGRKHYEQCATANLHRWDREAGQGQRISGVFVEPGDWGDVTSRLTRETGSRFAVLNMANAFVPGGAYIEGTSAQEENMFRRTDCHLALEETELDRGGRYYTTKMTALVEGRDGQVYLDCERPRLCIRGAEDPDSDGHGYRFLEDDEVFSFYELRAAAQDLRDGLEFDPEDARRRIEAQLDTLIEAGIRHAVLGASGCGAFGNPASEVASLYAEAIRSRREHFAVLAFAIRSAGYGPDNVGAFHRAFEDV